MCALGERKETSKNKNKKTGLYAAKRKNANLFVFEFLKLKE
jgi:hypothetical protein